MDTLEVILENFRILRNDIREFKQDLRMSTEAVKGFGTRLISIEERHKAHQKLCEERYGKRIKRMAGRLKELGGQLDGQEITSVTARAEIEAEQRLGERASRRIKWAIGILVTIIGVLIPLLIHLQGGS